MLGLFFPGVILCGCFWMAFQEIATWVVPSIRRSVRMAYGVYLAEKLRMEFWQSLTWKGFEKEIAKIFRQFNPSIEETAGPGDLGVDLKGRSQTARFIVQCKKHTEPIGPSFVRELIGTLVRERADFAILASASGFSLAAVRAAGRNANGVVGFEPNSRDSKNWHPATEPA